MKKTGMILVCVLGSTSMLLAADHSMVKHDSSRTSSFDSGLNWDDGEAPAPGNNYFSAGYTLRTPETNSTSSSVHVFAGDSLTFNGGTLAWKSAGTVVVTNLIFDGGALQQWKDDNTARLAGNITVKNGKTLSISASEPNRREFAIYSDIHGAGNIEIQMNSTSTLKQTYFFGNNTNFTGQIRLRGLGKFGVCAETALGPNPSSFQNKMLDFGGTTLIITNSMAIDDPNRGIFLNNPQGGHNAPGGVFEVTGSAVAEIASQISGAAPLTKRGGGTLRLTNNKIYTGLTTVEGGTLELASGAGLLSSGIIVTGSSSVVIGDSLTNVILSAGGTLATAGAGCDVNELEMRDGWLDVDLSSASPDTTLIRVNNALTLAPFQVIKLAVNTNNTTEVAYRVLSAPNLGEFADHEFCLDKPWTGELSRIDDGTGGQVLLFTPTPPEKIIFKTDDDVMNTTGFLKWDCWSDGLSPTNEPTGVKTYVMETHHMRTPHDRSLTFGGKRFVQNGTSLALKNKTHIPSIEDLTVMNNASFGMAESPQVIMAGNIRLHPVLTHGSSYALSIAGSNSGRDLHLYAQLSGFGLLRLRDLGNPAYANSIYNFYAENTNFFGKLTLTGHSNFWLRITSERNIGGNPPAFRADQITFNGGGVSVTNDVTIDDSGRGITLSPNGGYLTMNDYPGAFTNGTPAAERGYEGGATLRAENAATLTILSPITGEGGLTKAGSGTLELGGGNSYSGLTTITQGGIVAQSANALGTGPLRVSGAGRLICRYSDSMPSNGVKLGGSIEFVNGGAVKVELEDGTSRPKGGFSVPLFLLPEGESISPEDVPVEHSLTNIDVEVQTSTVNSRILVTANFTYNGGTVFLLK